jgi:putative hydrolase of the HAD superfamily
MTIKTVFFDVGNTLLTPALSEARVLVEAAASLGATVDLELVEQNIPRMYEHYEQLYEADNSIWADEDRAVGIWLDIYEYLCQLVGLSKLGPKIAQASYETFLKPESWALFDDVLPTLDALKSRHVAIGLISNWDSSLADIIKGMGIDTYFDVVISSAVVGLHKPQPEIFELALREAGVSHFDALHVGDHLTADVAGAARVGITPVLIDRDNRHAAGEGHLRVQNLEDLIEYL